MAWAPGKGVKGKEFKEYWEADAGVSYIPFEKVPQDDAQVLDLLEEGGFIDEESLPQSLLDLRERGPTDKAVMNACVTSETTSEVMLPQANSVPSSLMPNTSLGIPMVIPQIMQPQFGMTLPGLLPPQSMVVQMPVAVPPPNQLMMVQPSAQALLAGTPLPVGSIPQMPHMTMPLPSIPSSTLTIMSGTNNSVPSTHATAGDATPTDEDGTSIPFPSVSCVGQSLQSSCSTSSASPNMFAVAHSQGISRPMLQLLPPVSSAGTPIPFPPPQVEFGFPPPPQLRPGVPNQNMPTVISMPNSFPWLQKTSSPGVGTDIRFTGPFTSNTVRPLLNQPSGMSNSQISNHVSADPQHIQLNSKVMPQKIGIHKDAGLPQSEGTFSNKVSRGDVYDRRGGISPESYNNDYDRVHDSQHEADVVDFPREMDMDMEIDMEPVPRSVGPPEFRPIYGGMGRGHWMPGPGPRFQRNLHPADQFPSRHGIPGHPNREMEYFHHQRPPGPRMHMPGPHGGPPMWGSNKYPPARGHDHYQNRWDYYDEARFAEEEEAEWRFRMNEERKRRDYRDMLPERKIEDRRHQRFLDYESQPNNREKKNNELPIKRGSLEETTEKFVSPVKRGGVEEATEKFVSPVKMPRRDQKVDLSCDLLRLQSYGNRDRMKAIMRKKEREFASKLQHLPKEVETCAANKVENENVSSTNPDITSDESNNEVIKNFCSAELKLDGNPDNPEISGNSCRKDRSDRKRSRWGRTLSQEREFQQKEVVLQGSENSQAATSINVNGDLSMDDACNLPTPISLTDPEPFDLAVSTSTTDISEDSGKVVKDLSQVMPPQSSEGVTEESTYNIPSIGISDGDKLTLVDLTVSSTEVPLSC